MLDTSLVKKKANFGTAPVFLTAISTILGAVMFLRFGYAVGNVGFLGTVAIILIGHLVTLPTALAISEIATNQKVEGGGEYYIISRSFGLTIGAAIGIALYLSQAISVAFYIIAFAQAFDPIIEFINNHYGLTLSDKRIFSLPTMVILAVVMLTKGADLGVKGLYVVASILLISMICFFAGQTGVQESADMSALTARISNRDDFFYVFSICFPAFTGMTAGVGLSGDLKNPKKSIPIGTLSATLVGMVIYIFIAYKLAISASPQALATDQLIMAKVALWGPIIPIGLACASLSSALGSIMVAPRTLQALAGDAILPVTKANKWLSRGRAKNNEPVNATLVTCAIATCILLIDDINLVAGIISMFFLVTYGALCTISFFQHFAADPSYRPVFRSRWYISLIGALMCFWLMFKLNPFYAILALGIMTSIYFVIRHYNADKKGMVAIFQGVIFQLNRKIQVFFQKADKEDIERHWRPSVVCISEDSFKRFAGFDLLSWIAHRNGFGTYIHLIHGYLSKETLKESKEAMAKLVEIADVTNSNVFIDTLVSPSVTSAIAQVIQLPGVSGKDNNMILFEFSKMNKEPLVSLIDNYGLVTAVGFDMCILASSERGFGYKREIDVWITEYDYENASLMILMAYVISGHPDWKKTVIKIFAVFPEDEIKSQRDHLLTLITTGRLPISPNNVEVIGQNHAANVKAIINQKSSDASLTIVGFRGELLKAKDEELFSGYETMGNILFMNSTKEKEIK